MVDLFHKHRRYAIVYMLNRLLEKNISMLRIQYRFHCYIVTARRSKLEFQKFRTFWITFPMYRPLKRILLHKQITKLKSWREVWNKKGKKTPQIWFCFVFDFIYSESFPNTINIFKSNQYFFGRLLRKKKILHKKWPNEFVSERRVEELP